MCQQEAEGSNPACGAARDSNYPNAVNTRPVHAVLLDVPSYLSGFDWDSLPSSYSCYQLDGMV